MSTDTKANAGPTLKRTIGLWGLVLYGAGDMLGSGIYALIGKAAGAMGNAIWLAFLASMTAALLTGLSYASLGSRYPRAAGAAYVTHRAFGRPFFSYLIGLAVLASGLTSFAAQSRAFAGYLSARLAGVPMEVIVLGFIACLGLVNFWGMRESSRLNAVCTAVEVSGLLVIILAGLRYWGKVDYFEPPAGHAALTLPLVLQGGVLTFYSFIGFEDMINVVEEVKEPRRVFPRAVLLALGAVTLIYAAVSISAVSVVPHARLAASKEPLVEVVRVALPAFPVALFTAISLFAITNTALLNFIMGSRLAYGMARVGLVPKRLGAVHPVRRTPHVAIAALAAIVLLLAFSGDLSALASATSALLLGVFIVINTALVVLKRRAGEPRGRFEIPLAVPVGGIVVCATLLAHARPRALLTALGLLAGIIALYFVMRPRGITEEAIIEMERADTE